MKLLDKEHMESPSFRVQVINITGVYFYGYAVEKDARVKKKMMEAEYPSATVLLERRGEDRDGAPHYVEMERREGVTV